jgi:alkanesulfonate monooxygenase SsuD/methylene tetrahydromethanopterin reductase-like flavin-dependent oxidoreductase (luciferase family)
MHSRALFAETFDVLLLAMKDKVLNYAGRHHVYSDVPMELEPVQKPHPPLWGGVNSPQSAVPVARRGMNALMNSPAAPAQKIIESYTSTFRANFGSDVPLPHLGIARLVHVAENEAEAHAAAARAYGSFYQSAATLYRRFATIPAVFPAEYEAVRAAGVAIVGNPVQVRAEIQKQVRLCGANYFAARFAFGDLALAQVQHSVELFAREVMPACQAAFPSSAGVLVSQP